MSPSREDAGPEALLTLQRQLGNRHVQRVLSRKGHGEPELPLELETMIQRARGAGRPLDHGIREQMEPAFGTDFRAVRVHTGGDADTLNRQLNARAFTTDQDIFFGAGEYSPGSPGGRELLAHELTHVVQQAGGIRGRMVVGSPEDALEEEADRVAKAVTLRLTDLVVTGLSTPESPPGYERITPSRGVRRQSTNEPWKDKYQWQLATTPTLGQMPSTVTKYGGGVGSTERTSAQQPAPVKQARSIEAHYSRFVATLTGWWISDTDVDSLLQTLDGLRQIDARHPLVEDSAFTELVIRLRDRKEGNLLKVLLDELDDDHYQRYPDVIVALMVHLPLAEQLSQAVRAAGEILLYNFDFPSEQFATAAVTFQPEVYLTSFLDQKTAEIKYYAKQGDEDGLRTSLRDFYGLYDQLLDLLFAEDLPRIVKFLWSRFKEPDKLPRITDPSAKGTGVVPAAKSAEFGAGKRADTGKKKGAPGGSDAVIKMVTSLAEKAYQTFVDLAKFSSGYPIVIEAANTVAREFKRIEEKRLIGELVVQEGDTVATAGNTDSLAWIDLVRIWFWELGPKSLQQLEFGRDALTTQDVKKLLGVRWVVGMAWDNILNGNYEPYTQRVNYGPPEFFNSLRNRNKAFNFLGTYAVTVTPKKKPAAGAKSVCVEILVTTDTSLESFGRFRKPDPKKPDDGNRPILENRKQRTDPGVKIGSTLKTQWSWPEELPLWPEKLPLFTPKLYIHRLDKLLVNPH